MTYRVVVDPVPDEQHQGATYSASVNDQRPFIVGQGVSYAQRRGVMSLGGDLLFEPEDYPQAGQWGQLIDCTSFCESGRVLTCLNTYDRAAFTFGCLQFAAHVPDGDFVTWFRALLQRADAANFFADLKVVEDRIWRVRDGSNVQLESGASTAELMSYLNPNGARVDFEEVAAAAKLIYWTASDAAVRGSQIELGTALFRSVAARHAGTLRLDGRPDFVVAAILDILHQGRGSTQTIQHALEPSSVEVQLDRLLAIGAEDYASRCSDLRSIIEKKRTQGKFGLHTYNTATGDFIAAGRSLLARLTDPTRMLAASTVAFGAARDPSVAAPSGSLVSALAVFDRRKDCVPFAGITAPDANIPGNILVVSGTNEFHSFREEDILDREPIDERSSRLWVRAGAQAWRSSAIEIAGMPQMRETLVGMEGLPPPSVPPVPGMPEEASASHRTRLLSLALERKTIAGAAATYNGTCAGGDQYANNCAHFLSDAFIRAGYEELLPGGSAGGFATARCGTSAKRVIRARDMWHWFQSRATATATQLERNSGLWAVFQLKEQVYWGGHVVIVDTDTWTYHGTGCYFGWDQHAYKW